ncbi:MULTISPECIES: peptidylprolyl isomerase [unclassified Alcanivorax]|jgi:cyclophilin family peptidyl-prolyl cis-trans isomerase|uniref:peptidylprolyl isomerase n=1 Tax=unclassified Alcanivorax TaxID=2638842 RepID=UPI00017ECC14|nr:MULTISPECIES: peptidylprolyl isomerase [unclassified Alcanivorax]EDX89382.1 peptidyl-prolyl cis-trans isomerase, cyclophilin-type, putative [Alcanivorax sp. DG881]
MRLAAALLALLPGLLLANPVVRLDTTAGPVTIELYEDKAPKSVANFLQYVDSGFYNGTQFHRVISGFMIQGGGFDQSGQRKATREPIQNEADNGLKNKRGTLAMARTSNPHSATAQFFVNLVDNRNLDFTGKSTRGWGYTVFGAVTDGMNVVDNIARERTTSQRLNGMMARDVPEVPILITKAYRLEDDSTPAKQANEEKDAQ